jgi:hypothetical protein
MFGQDGRLKMAAGEENLPNKILSLIVFVGAIIITIFFLGGLKGVEKIASEVLIVSDPDYSNRCGFGSVFKYRNVSSLNLHKNES